MDAAMQIFVVTKGFPKVDEWRGLGTKHSPRLRVPASPYPRVFHPHP
jgi:hypothetical protein